MNIDHFKYLISVIDKYGTIDRDVDLRVQAAWSSQILRINERPLTFDDAPKGWVAVKFRVEGQTNFRFILTTTASCSDQVHCIIY